jgi:flagellar export protein FliJ
LRAVLEQRKGVERACMLRLAEARGRRELAEARLREVAEAIRQRRGEWRESLLGNGRDFSLVRSSAGSIVKLEARARQLAIGLAGALHQEERVRADLLRATTARKAIETLRDRQLEEWHSEQRARENTALDELVVSRHGRGEEAA